MSDKLSLRLARLEDAPLLLAWRNDETTRRNSIVQDVISSKQHEKWLAESLTNPARQLFIAQINDTAIGTVRVDSNADVKTISWTLAPEHRGKGLAKEMVKFLVDKLNGSILAQILPDNIASIRVAEHAGLKYQRTENGIMYFVRKSD